MSDDGRMDEPKMAWDMKKHDSNIPPEAKVVEMRCPKCRQGAHFQTGHRMNLTIMPGGIAVGMQKPDVVVCMSCGEAMPVQEVVEHARKSLNQPAALPFKKGRPS